MGYFSLMVHTTATEYQAVGGIRVVPSDWTSEFELNQK